MAKPIFGTTIPDAADVPFDGTVCDPDFDADNVQDAICEARISALGSLLTFPFVATGNTADKWLGYANSAAPSNDIPYIVPQNADLKGIAFSNADDDVDIDIQIFRNGSLLHTELIRNKRWYLKAGISGSPTFSQGDRISVFLKKFTGGSGDQTAQDPSVILVIKFTNEVAATLGAQFGVT